MKKVKKIALAGLICTCAILLSYVEMLLPPFVPALPAIKAGLANIVIIFALYVLSFRYACAISLVRVCIITLLFGNPVMLVYSIAGALASLTVMWLLKKMRAFSVTGVSIAGGIFHNLGQILIAVVLFATPQLFYYMSVLTLTGTLAGVTVGVAGALVIRFYEKNS